MDIQKETRCKVCNQKMEFLQHELTVIPFIKEMAFIGEPQKQKVCNVRFYCQNCKVNMAKPYPYSDVKFVPAFINDVKKHSAHFDNLVYIEL